MLIGPPWLEDGKLYNAVALLDGGRITGLRFKVDLPNYGVFDEKRVFAPGPLPGPMNFRGVRIGVPICEDIWKPEPCRMPRRDRRRNPPRAERLALSPRQPSTSASTSRSPASIESGLPLVYVNQVGGQDELVFDGASFALNADCIARLPASRLPRGRRAHRMAARRRRVEMRDRPAGAARGRRRGRLRRLHAGPSRLRREERLSRRRARPFRRHRLRALRGARRRCARAAARALRDAALQIHLAGFARRRRSLRQGARRALRHDPDRARGRRARSGARRRSSRASSATSPKKICSRARAAPS